MSLFDDANDSGGENPKQEDAQPKGDQVAKELTLTLASLPDDLKDEKMFENLRGKGDVELLTELAKQVHGLQKLQGGMIRIPGNDASDEARKGFMDKLTEVEGIIKMPETDEDISALYTKLGRPAEVDGYKLEGVQGEGLSLSQEDLAGYKQLAHKAGLTQKQFEAVLQADLERAKFSATATNQTQLERKTKTDDVLKKEWVDYDDRMKAAELAANVLGNKYGAEFIEDLKASGAVHNPIVRACLAMAAKDLSEESIIDLGDKGFANTREELEAELKEVMQSQFGGNSLAKVSALREKASKIRQRLRG